jgi:hypothetical protein
MPARRSIRWPVWMAVSIVLGASGAGCSDPCEAAAPSSLHCCDHSCDDDVLIQPVCTASGWGCPQGSVSFADCPGPRVCMGPLPGPGP